MSEQLITLYAVRLKHPGSDEIGYAVYRTPEQITAPPVVLHRLALHYEMHGVYVLSAMLCQILLVGDAYIVQVNGAIMKDDAGEPLRYRSIIEATNSVEDAIKRQ